jgi:hypothetical protein
LRVLEPKDDFVAIMESCLVRGGLRQPVNLWGRSPADPTPPYVGEFFYKATIAGGRKEFFSGGEEKLLLIVVQ